MARPSIAPEAEVVEHEAIVPLYRVVLLDDNDHTYDYVIEMLQKIFIFTLDQAHGRARFMRSESDPIVLPDPRTGPPPGTTGGTTQGKRGK